MRRFLFLFLFSAILVTPLFVNAVALGGLDATAGTAGIQSVPKDPNTVVGNVLKPIISLVGVLFFCLMLYAGALWMSAAGDDKKIELAKQIILAAVIGLIIVASAYAITSFIGNSIGGTPSV